MELEKDFKRWQPTITKSGKPLTVEMINSVVELVAKSQPKRDDFVMLSCDQFNRAEEMDRKGLIPHHDLRLLKHLTVWKYILTGYKRKVLTIRPLP